MLFVVPSSSKSRFGSALGMQPLAAPRRPFGSGSLLLAPLSNFRAGTLPTTVSLPHSHKPETDSLPACLAARSPSLSLLPSVSRCLSALCHSISLPFPLSFSPLFIYFFCLLSLPLRPFSSVSVWFSAFSDYRPAVSLTASKSRRALPLSLVSSLFRSPVCISAAPTADQ